MTDILIVLMVDRRLLIGLSLSETRWLPIGGPIRIVIQILDPYIQYIFLSSVPEKIYRLVYHHHPSWLLFKAF